jgi:sulfide:quinone oxidoreductase
MRHLHHAYMSAGANGRMRVLIAGGGVAALEAMVALRALAEERVDITLLAPDRDFFYRPLAVAEPFGLGQVQRFDLATHAQGCGARHELGSVVSVDPEEDSEDERPGISGTSSAPGSSEQA